MYILFGILILLAVALLILLFLSNFLPTSWTIEKVVDVQADAELIFPLLNTPASWPTWSVWNEEQNMSFSYEGPSSGPAATQIWEGSQFNNGKMIIQDVTKYKSVSYLLELEKGKFNITGLIVLDAAIPGYTQVAWRCQCELARKENPIHRFQAFILKNHFNQSLEESLQGLKGQFNQES